MNLKEAIDRGSNVRNDLSCLTSIVIQVYKYRQSLNRILTALIVRYMSTACTLDLIKSLRKKRSST